MSGKNLRRLLGLPLQAGDFADLWALRQWYSEVLSGTSDPKESGDFKDRIEAIDNVVGDYADVVFNRLVRRP